MKMARYFVSFIALIAVFALVPASAQDESFSGNNPVSTRTEVYAQGTWAVAYVPEARHSEQVPYGRLYFILAQDEDYVLKTNPEQVDYCFLVSHRSSEFGDQLSYLGVAAFSILKPGTNPIEPVSMFRNGGWRRGNTHWEQSDIGPSTLGAVQFFEAHSSSHSVVALDKLLGFEWHGQYREDRSRHSWKDKHQWNLIENIGERELNRLGGSDWQDTRFDGKLIRFTFTRKKDSRKPPKFCLDNGKRLATIITLFSPHMTGTKRFTFVFK